MRLIHTATALASIMVTMMVCMSGAASAAEAPRLLPAMVESQGQNLERRIMAAFLFKFGDFIDWPPGTFKKEDQPLVIGVLGDDDMVEDLRRIAADKRVHGRRAEIHKVDPNAAINAQILYIAPGQRQVEGVLEKLRGKPVVTVTAGRDNAFIGTINFVIENDRVRFDIALDEARQEGLKISARLLRVARRVYGGAG